MQEDRRSFFSNIWQMLAAIFGGLLFAAPGKGARGIRIGQVEGAPNALAGFDGTGQGMSVAVGQGLSFSGGTLSASSAAQIFPNVDVRLARDPSGNYPLPATVQARTTIHNNGLRQLSPEQYTIVNNVVIPGTQPPWIASDIITADGYPV